MINKQIEKTVGKIVDVPKDIIEAPIKTIKKLSPLFKKIKIKIGSPPGSLDYVGDAENLETTVKLRAYNQDDFIEEVISDPTRIKESLKEGCVNWIEVTGLRDLSSISEIGNQFNIHPMLLEDILNTQHLPKYEEGENYSAIILKAFWDDGQGSFKKNHITLVLTNNTIIQFQDLEHDLLKAKIGRIKQSRGRARKLKVDYLYYVLLDAFIDSYYVFFTNMNEKSSELEERLLSKGVGNLMDEIHSLKAELNDFRKNLFPLRDTITNLIEDEPKFINKKNMIFFSDLKDHLNQLVEYYLHYNENIKALVDLNSAILSNNLNAVMKTLTIIATIFIPLTFIAGIYGMNFEFMPELGWKWGYFIVWGVMVLVTLGMFIFFRRKNWL
ncbi:MAG: magnesium/cobalt transporter CorA [Ignavibacteria bacterium]|nr:magnesium/cobalt transporter CorA [Ignavibacteria bacterium]MBT8381102.1 magnesium/cobalt transporter CorA [Ignavibacteria bacterium]MBT8392138.1 magnesium/cobalt transporter CorA [Ignavibacteria bacterium]NNJ53538.1 magnesium/cobalt transporter CorA [Ignavibacteriaceae bacterium]NNL20465.1 magnesium/cobalt transporter CorA [Ignavibacteriaceae bacterium]